MNSISLKPLEEFSIQFSICTLVTNLEEYREMLTSFVNAGFSEIDCEYLFADNTLENNLDAYVGINRFIRQAKGKYIIICHQDILLDYDKRDKLEKCINEISYIDDNWAVVGNAGGNNIYKISMIISETDGKVHNQGILPSRVYTLDENFLLIKASANLAVSSNLSGFHLYGTDLCIIAECLGYTSYAIDFHLLHKSSGKADTNFYLLKRNLIKKYELLFKGRYFKTTITSFYISGCSLNNWFKNTFLIKKIYRTIAKCRYIYFNRI